MFVAYTARIAIIRHTERSIDAQYYMIHHDLVGILFGEQLIEAAERGVRVRLLLDDIDLADRDESIAIAASHPNISVRVFNPFSRSFRSRASQAVTGFGKVTRRMHNKSLTVDNQITIVGGRNIGDEYFDADPDLAFSDLDLLGIFLPLYDEIFMYFTESKVTSDFIVDCLEKLWPDLKERYFPDMLVLNLGNGPGNSSHRTQFVKRIVDFVHAK